MYWPYAYYHPKRTIFNSGFQMCLALILGLTFGYLKGTARISPSNLQVASASQHQSSLKLLSHQQVVPPLQLTSFKSRITYIFTITTERVPNKLVNSTNEQKTSNLRLWTHLQASSLKSNFSFIMTNFSMKLCE